jgi:restriction system protein
MLGAGSAHVAECVAGNFVGTDYGIARDLTGELNDDWRVFNKSLIPEFLAVHPEKTRIGAGLSCGAIWTVSRGMAIGDIALCPDGSGRYLIGEIVGPYHYEAGGVLPHRRPVRWTGASIERSSMSVPLRNSTGSIGAIANINSFREEIEQLIGKPVGPHLSSSDETIEDVAAFAMERHLEDFLIQNWNSTDLGKAYDIYADGDALGQQLMTDTGPLDILALSKDRKTLLVIELKKGRTSDAVVGQTLRYMGYVQDVLAEPSQTVRGAIIALEDDQRIRRALSMVPSIEFFRYEIDFRLVKS